MSKRGLFITFEGPEGAGKSTHAEALGRWLRGRGIPVLVTREPGGTPIGQRIRRLLLDRRSGAIDPLVELWLYEAARSALVVEVIWPALKAGKICIVDRFQDSTWVYQGWAGEVPLAVAQAAGKMATGGLRPDVTILLDLPVEKGLRRVRRPNRMEEKSLLFHKKVRAGYLVLARRERRRFHVIRADAPIEEVREKIRQVIGNVLEKHRWA